MNARAFAAMKRHLEEGLAPYRPDVDGPWNRSLAGHLARRVAFGMPPVEVERILREGPGEAVARILQPTVCTQGEALAESTARQVGSRERAQGAWVYRMLLGSNPAREKLALFWHGHFATSDRKVEDPVLMSDQIALFRERGTGPLGELVLAVARDPAMLIWLDGNSNRRGRPNENFARELFELFCLGIGNYTERDIQEAARAFTGWHVRSKQFAFVGALHDGGEKEVLGRRANLDGADVVRTATEQPACARFVARKLYEYYVAPGPSEDLVEALGERYRECGLDTGEFLRGLLSSRLFFASAALRALVAAPVDFAIGSLRTLEATASPNELVRAIAAMGQELLLPPSVKGWESGLGWLRSTTLLARYRFAEDIAASRMEARVPWERLESPQATFDRLFPFGLEPAVRAEVAARAKDDPRTLVASCLELPEYQFI